MSGITNVFNLNKSRYTDPRSRLNILPAAIIKTSGNVTGEECLPEDRPLQPFLGELTVCSLKNVPGHEHAMVLIDYGRELPLRKVTEQSLQIIRLLTALMWWFADHSFEDASATL
ncbi:MAG: hypothetical protein IKE85_07390 [Mogibacterium sp.]|nr:hypothetical protein [Mogibacterium sp.]